MASRPLVPNGTYRIKSGSSNTYLDCSPNTGFVTANPSSGAPFQQWIISSAGDGDYEIKSAANGQALHVNGQNQLSCSASTRRVTWTIEPRGSDAYVFVFCFYTFHLIKFAAGSGMPLMRELFSFPPEMPPSQLRLAITETVSAGPLSQIH
ncbi:hypothetical protein BYT27DRAFT_6734193 [Phlegmacium glaucopus]|nr:hypothetical protein BYT27DRAFT_6734193 [Phlegmacium glaucopus]